MIEEIGKSRGADGVTNAWAMQQAFTKSLDANAQVAQLVQTLLNNEVSKGGKDTQFTGALLAVKNEIQKTGAPSAKSLSNVYEMLGDNSKAKAIVSTALKDVSNSNNNNGDKNFVDKSQNDRNQTEGETVTSADGTQIARNLTGVTGNSNAESDQDNNTDSNNQDTTIIASNLKDLNKKADFNPLKSGLSFPEKSVVSRIEKLVGGLSKDIVDLVKKSSDQGDLPELQKTWNNQTKVSNKKDND
ncbi:MAG: hypothetical protein AABZ74_16085 [Cyanobacteriota bacterium]